MVGKYLNFVLLVICKKTLPYPYSGRTICILYAVLMVFLFLLQMYHHNGNYAHMLLSRRISSFQSDKMTLLQLIQTTVPFNLRRQADPIVQSGS